MWSCEMSAPIGSVIFSRKSNFAMKIPTCSSFQSTNTWTLALCGTRFRTTYLLVRRDICKCQRPIGTWLHSTVTRRLRAPSGQNLSWMLQKLYFSILADLVLSFMMMRAQPREGVHPVDRLPPVADRRKFFPVGSTYRLRCRSVESGVPTRNLLPVPHRHSSVP